MKKRIVRAVIALAVLAAWLLPCAALAARSGSGRGELLTDQFSYETAALQFPRDSRGQWEFYGGEEYTMYVEIVNTSRTKTVSKYVMEAEALDAYGFPLESMSLTVEGKIAPGERVLGGGMEMCYGRDVYLVYASIVKVVYTDGTVEEMSCPVKGCWYVE